MKNPKTTLFGVLTILAALCNAGLIYLKTGQVDLIGLFATISAGIVGITAKDNNVTNAPRPVDATKVVLPVIALLFLLGLSGCAGYTGGFGASYTAPDGGPTYAGTFNLSRTSAK